MTSSPGRMLKIRALNDAFRQTFAGGKVVVSAGVAELADIAVANALLEVARYDRFDEDNDPYGEHDFGAFEFLSRTFFWKIELYEDPDVKDANGEPQVTRVLTLMLAHEW
jgi:hypothetical protein